MARTEMQKRARADAEKRKVTEASNRALKELRAAKSDLDSAFRWGIIDVVGGMYVVSGIKIAKIEAAKEHLRQAMRSLQQLRREGDTTDYVNQKYMHMGPLGTVLDFGLDGIGPDIYAQARIAGLRSRVKEAIRRLETIMRAAGIDEERW